MRWFGVQAKFRVPEPPAAATSNCSQSSVVVVVDDLPGGDLTGCRVHRHDLDRHPLVDDLPDLLGAAVGQHHPRVIMEAAEHNADLLADLVGEHAQRVGAV
jgi:hypothetical protein